MKIKQITIIGVGLIGGSIGLAVKKRSPSLHVIGVTRHRISLEKARRRGAIDLGTLEVEKSVRDSDLVILATPVEKISSTLQKIRPYLKRGCIVMDIASVKGAIVHNAERIIGRKGSFVGTHPMAGSEQRGIERADGNLFRGAPCIVTKTPKTDLKAMRFVSDFWEAMGSKTYILSPLEHDKKISNISHLPHVAAFALSLVAQPSSLTFASTGFKDTTRIAASNPELWASILLANRKNVIEDMGKYIKQLRYLRDLIFHRQTAELNKLLSKAKKKRDMLG